MSFRACLTVGVSEESGVGTYLRPQPDPLRMEHRFPEASLAGLEALGHEAAWTEEAAGAMGHASAIMIDWEPGVPYAAADPRSDGAALGW